MSFGIPVRNGLGVGLLASTFLSTRNRAPFSPASLFATGEQGAWYDPSDLTTLFQDSLGITPVTAAAQQVGLALDKSQGLVLGPELVTNGTFESGVTGWTKGTGTTNPLSWDSVGKRMVITNDLAYFASATQVISGLTVGRSYLITGVVSSNTVQAKLNIISGSESNFVPAGGGVARLIFTATSTSHTLAATNQQNTLNGVAYWDDISFKLLPGNHAFQSNSAQRPTLGRNPFTGTRNLLTFTEQFNDAVWTKTRTSVSVNTTAAPDGTTTADTLVEDTTASNTHVLNRILGSPLAAATYTYSIYAKAAGRRYIELILIVDPASTNVRYATMFDLQTGTITTTSSASSPTATANAIQAADNGWYRCSITIGNPSGLRVDVSHALSDTPTAPALAVAPAYTGDGVSGAFIWGAQLETGSTATAYQRVVSSFDVTQAGVPDVWYLSFDGTDDGMLTGTITPGTDKAQIFSGVRKLTSTAGIIAELSTSIGNAGTFYVASGIDQGVIGTGDGYASLGRGSTSANPAQTAQIYQSSPDTAVLAITHDIPGDLSTIRRNGVAGTNATADKGTGNFLAYPLYIGRRAGTSLPLNGRIYSFILRFGANLPASTISQTEVWVGGKTGVTI
jgi:hypothetical protein